MDKVVQAWGGGVDERTVVDTFYFPQDNSMYSEITLHISFDCPSGGCDPWDRFANLKLIRFGKKYEIARYMTPYGKACAAEIDVTDYRSLLRGQVILESFVDTWVNPAWLVTYDFEFKAGTPAFKYVKIDNLWTNEHVTYGDTSKPIDLAPVTITTDPNLEEVAVRMINTGHGQGNTDNAAEFSQKTHELLVDGNVTHSELLWRSDCSSNPECPNQAGTWQFPRANWCPGKGVIPSDFDVKSEFTAGDAVQFEYKLQDYTNMCSPNHPDCVTGVTCNDCDYNNNGHTEPHYKIHAQLIQRSNSPDFSLGIDANLPTTLEAVLYPNPAKTMININASEQVKSVSIYSVLGERVLTVDNANTIAVDHLPAGIYIVEITGKKSGAILRFIKE